MPAAKPCPICACIEDRDAINGLLGQGVTRREIGGKFPQYTTLDIRRHAEHTPVTSEAPASPGNVIMRAEKSVDAESTLEAPEYPTEFAPGTPQMGKELVRLEVTRDRLQVLATKTNSVQIYRELNAVQKQIVELVGHAGGDFRKWLYSRDEASQPGKPFDSSVL